MRFSIISEIPGRTRLQLAGPVPESDLDALLKLSGDIDGVHKVRVYGRIGQMALEYDEQCRAGVLDALCALDAQAIADAKTGYVMQLEPRKHKLVMDLATLIGAHYARRWFLPTPLRAVFVVAGYMAFLRAALHELAQPRLTVPVLDASAIGISFVKRDVDTAGQTMFLLNVGELLEDYTRAMSENELINSLLDVPDKAQKVVGDTEVSVAATELEPGDLVAVRTGMSICIDGVVEQGSAMVNQATLTGEPLAVERSVGDDVFAGTVVEDGSILVCARQHGSDQAPLDRLARADGRLAQVRGPVAHGGPCQQDRPVELPARGPGCAYHPQPHQDLSGTDGRLLVRAQTHGFRRRHDCHERRCQDGRHGQGRQVL